MTCFRKNCDKVTDCLSKQIIYNTMKKKNASQCLSKIISLRERFNAIYSIFNKRTATYV